MLQLSLKNNLVTLLLLLCVNVAMADEVAKAIYVRGTVKFIHEEVEGLLLQGQSVVAGDEIITGNNDLVILSYVNNSKIKIDPSSHIIIEELEPEQTGQKLTLFVKLGHLMIQFFNPKKDSQLQVRAKNAALGVRGTRFSLGLDETEGHVHVAVDEGSVAVMSTEDDDHELVENGQHLVMEEGRRLTKPYAAQWIRKLDWGMGNNESGFRNHELRALRVKEFLARRPQLVQRRAKIIAPLLKQRFHWNENKQYKGLPKKEAIKKLMGKMGQNKKMDDKNRRRLKDRVKERIRRRKELRENAPVPTPIKPPDSTQDRERN